MPQAVTACLLLLVLAVVQAPLLADLLVRWAGGLTLALTLACGLVPWDRLPYRSYLVIPVPDSVDVGVLVLDEAGRPRLTNNGHLQPHAQPHLARTWSAALLPERELGTRVRPCGRNVPPVCPRDIFRA